MPEGWTPGSECQIHVAVTRCVDDVMYPSAVQFELTDAFGERRTFVEKVVILGGLDDATRDTPMPCPAVMYCRVLRLFADPAGRRLAEVEGLWGVETVDEIRTFQVLEADLHPPDPPLPVSPDPR